MTGAFQKKKRIGAGRCDGDGWSDGQATQSYVEDQDLTASTQPSTTCCTLEQLDNLTNQC